MEFDQNQNQKMNKVQQIKTKLIDVKDKMYDVKEKMKGQLEAELRIVEGMPGSKINKKHNIKALTKLNAKTFAREIRNGAKGSITFRGPRKWRKNSDIDRMLADLSTKISKDLEIRLLQKTDFEQ